MFKRIAVAFDESPGAFHALTSAISLAKTLGAELQTVTVVEPPRAYTAYVITLPVLSRVLSDDRVKFYEQLEEIAATEDRRHDIAIRTTLVTNDEVEAIVEFLRREKMDLLVVALHRYTPRLARLWSTVYALEQEAPCSVLGIH